MDQTNHRAHKTHYTIMPDYGMAYGWMNERGTDDLGGSHADTIAWAGEHPISQALHADFVAWQKAFEEAPTEWVPEWGKEVVLLDWQRYHERGLALTRRLKAELGDAARVFYEKPVEDPNGGWHERVEILWDGKMVKLPSGSSSVEVIDVLSVDDFCR